MEKYFFEIPIFRCEQRQLRNEIEADIQKTIAYFKKGDEIKDYDYDALARPMFNGKFANYRYGELVGMIRLFSIPGQIRGELLFVNQRISKKLKNKTWALKGKAFELWINRSDTNETIFNKIIQRLKEIQKESKRISKCYIDKTCFETIGSCIDFIKLQENI